MVKEALEKYRDLPLSRKIGVVILGFFGVVLIVLFIYSGLVNDDDTTSSDDGDTNNTIVVDPSSAPDTGSTQTSVPEKDNSAESTVDTSDGGPLPIIQTDKLSAADRRSLLDAARNVAIQFSTVKKDETLQQRNARVYKLFTGNTQSKEFDPVFGSNLSSNFADEKSKTKETIYSGVIDTTATKGGTTSRARVLVNMNITATGTTKNSDGKFVSMSYASKYIIDMKKVNGQWKALLIADNS